MLPRTNDIVDGCYNQPPGACNSCCIPVFGYRRLKQKFQPISYPILFTMIYAGFGSFCFGIDSIRASANAVGFRDFSVVSESDTGRRIRRPPQSLDDAVLIMFGVAACLGKSTKGRSEMRRTESIAK